MFVGVVVGTGAPVGAGVFDGTVEVGAGSVVVGELVSGRAGWLRVGSLLITGLPASGSIGGSLVTHA